MSYPEPVIFIEAGSISDLEDKVNKFYRRGYVLNGSPQNVGNKSYFVTMFFDEASVTATSKYDDYLVKKGE